MPLPLFIGAAAAVAGVVGVGSGIHGGIKMKEANDTMEVAKDRQERAVRKFERWNKETLELMDSVGKKELEILNSFERFSNVLEQIQGRPEFKNNIREGVKLPEYEAEELKNVSAAAGVLLGGLGGAAAGTAGGFAAAGATTSAVMALGCASTGTAISSLTGVAATNATLAALGGGSLASGGGGMALGASVLGGATLGVGLLVGGVIFSVTGSKLSEKADEAYSQARRTEREVDKIVEYFKELKEAATGFYSSLNSVESQYMIRLDKLDDIVNKNNKKEWSKFTADEKKLTQNLILLVGILYKMCKVQLVLKDTDDDGYNSVNNEAINEVIDDSKEILKVIL